MKDLLSILRFLVACAVIFGCGYFVAKPHNTADRMFAPGVCLMAMAYLWRRDRPKLFSI
jgi:hypothetical protein